MKFSSIVFTSWVATLFRDTRVSASSTKENTVVMRHTHTSSLLHLDTNNTKADHIAVAGINDAKADTVVSFDDSHSAVKNTIQKSPSVSQC